MIDRYCWFTDYFSRVFALMTFKMLFASGMQNDRVKLFQHAIILEANNTHFTLRGFMIVLR